MAETKTDKQARAIIAYVNKYTVVRGEQLKTWLKAAGYNLWQSSILVSKMVTDGRLKVANKVYDDGDGKTWRRSYGVTEKGIGWAANGQIQALVKEIDIEPVVSRAIESGKWTALPDGVEWDIALGLKRRGFDVRVFVRFVEGDKLHG